MASRSVRLPARYYRHSPAVQRGYVTEDLELSLDETVFMIIDVYGHGFDPDGDTGNQPEFNKDDIAIYRPTDRWIWIKNSQIKTQPCCFNRKRGN